MSKKQLLTDLNWKVEHLMADITGLTNAVNALTATETSVIAELQRLSQVIADGGTVSQADIDALTAKVQGVASDINDQIARDPK